MKVKRFVIALLLLCLSVTMLSMVVSATTLENETVDAASLAAPVITRTNTASTGKCKLSWEAVDGADRYTVYRSTSASSGFKELATTKKLACTDSSAKLGVKYYYKVKATNSDASVKSAYSNCVSGIRDLPAPVITRTNTASSGYCKVSWEEVSGASKYTVYRSTSASSGFKELATTKKLAYTDTSAKLGTKYYYKVKAIHSISSANSAYSNCESGIRDLAQPEITRTNTASTGKCKLSWEAVSGAAKYTIYRSTSASSGFKELATTKKLAYTDSSAKVGTKYYYKIRAIHDNSSSNSAYSNCVSGIRDLAQPEIARSTTKVTSIKISWDKISGATKYAVYRATSKSGTYKKIGSTSSASYTDGSVSAGKTYYYKIKATNGTSSADSAYSNIISAKAIPSAPKMAASATVTKNSIKISWDAVSGASGYYIYSRKSTSDDWKKIDTVSSGTTSFTHKSASGKNYYSVVAYKTISGTTYTGYRSDSIKTSTLANVASVSLTGGSADFTHDVSWSAVSGATGYQIYYKVGEDGSWKKAATVGDVTTYTNTVNVHGEYCYYKVRPIYQSGGTTSYGKFTEHEYGHLWYYSPELYTSMSSETETSTTATVIYVENNGVAPVYFFAEGGMWYDADYDTYDREIVLYDYEAYQNGYLEETDEVCIEPGEHTWLLIGVVGEPTWYDLNTYIYLQAFHDGMYFDTYTSSYGGCTYYAIN